MSGSTSERRVIAGHAGTVLIGQLAVMAFGVIDTIVAGRYAEEALAALSVGAAIFISVYVSLMGGLQALLPVFERIYEDTDTWWAEYHLCEDLVDLETQFQLWRFRHMRTVMRIIGFKRGTGGSSGVGFLRQARELTFFPELFEVRTVIGMPPTGD